jgi:hypothetical protein
VPEPLVEHGLSRILQARVSGDRDGVVRHLVSDDRRFGVFAFRDDAQDVSFGQYPGQFPGIHDQDRPGLVLAHLGRRFRHRVIRRVR